MCKPLTHGRSGPQSGRLDRMVEAARGGRLVDDIDHRQRVRDAEAAEGMPPRKCPKCGLYLLPGEVTECRYCAEKKAEPE